MTGAHQQSRKGLWVDATNRVMVAGLKPQGRPHAVSLRRPPDLALVAAARPAPSHARDNGSRDQALCPRLRGQIPLIIPLEYLAAE